mmetsp:Transcript_27364/g.45631  ORF Transcript_27364/g.45631 Transcript_27364/m.45631 type:complete len:444 (-) Transcript_27364:360-1691(-)
MHDWDSRQESAEKFIDDYADVPTAEEAATVVLAGVTKPRTASDASIIFTLWNTMMGSTLLIMPYSFHECGWVLGVAMALVIAYISKYTTAIIVRYGMPLDPSAEFADLAHTFLGRKGWGCALIASLGVCLGAACAMHGYLAKTLDQLFDNEHDDGGFGLKHELTRMLGKHQQGAAAALALIVLFPLVNMPSMSLLARFNSMGVICVLCILLVAIVSATIAGPSPSALESSSIAQPIGTSSKVLGIFSLAFFVQNCSITVFRAAANQQNNERNLRIAYVLVYFTYVGMGLISTVCPPLHNEAALSTFGKRGFLALKQPPQMAGFLLAARVAVLLQCITVYPVLLYFVRAQFFSAFIYRKAYPGVLPVLALNLLLVGTTAAITIGGVDISDILRFTGAFSSLICIYGIPAFLQWRLGTSPVWRRFVILVSLLGTGILCVVVQLLP